MEARALSIQPQGPIDLKTLSRDELETFAEGLGTPRFRGRQIYKWIYGKGATAFEEMTDLPLNLRERLSQIAHIGVLRLVRLRTAADETVKALFELPTGRFIESVLIPDLDAPGKAVRLTVCVSSQVGCAMGCSFCATGTMGFQQNLTPGEIYDQALFMNRLALDRYGKPVSNIVFMGMGEPLLNFDNVLVGIEALTHPDGLGLASRRITLSTVGLARRIKQLADRNPNIRLAVSLHAPTEEKRSSIMPVNRAAATDLDALRDAVQYFTTATGSRVTYEYCMFRDFNDSTEDAHRLADVVEWAPSKVNLIMYNAVEGLSFQRTPEDRLEAFIRTLVRRGVTVTVRRSRGQDIDAACGQLAVKEG